MLKDRWFFLHHHIDQILKIIQITNVQIKTELHQMNEIDVHVSILPLCIIVQDNWWWWVAKNILGGITKGKDTYKCVTCSCNKDLYCQFLFDDLPRESMNFVPKLHLLCILVLREALWKLNFCPSTPLFLTFRRPCQGVIYKWFYYCYRALVMPTLLYILLNNKHYEVHT